MQSREIKFGECPPEQKDTLLSEIESAGYAAYRAAKTEVERAAAMTVIEKAMQARKAIFERVAYDRRQREDAEQRGAHSERMAALRAARTDPDRPSKEEIFEDLFGGMKPTPR